MEKGTYYIFVTFCMDVLKIYTVCLCNSWYREDLNFEKHSVHNSMRRKYF